MSVLESFLTTPEVTEALSDRRFVAGMLLFHAALSRAQASNGVIPASAAQSIVGTCKVELFDVPKLTRESGRVRCLADPLLHHLRETVALFNPDAAKFVGYGCTRQNLVDTALAMVSRDALTLVCTDVSRTLTTLLRLAGLHAATPVLLQQPGASPELSSFGLQCVQWATPLARSLLRLNAWRGPSACCASGRLALRIVGVRAQKSDQNTAVAALMATTDSWGVQRCAWRVGDEWWMLVASELGLLIASQGRMAAELGQ
jgi:3-carboxy-cis,cis-muconate cycloisomerase